MAARDVFQFACPCCGKEIEVNTRSGKARAVKFEESQRGTDFDGLLDRHRGEGERLESMFDEARSDQSRQSERLDAMFRDAEKKAKDDPDDERPLRPFDLD